MLPHIVVVDDDLPTLELMKLVLEAEEGYQVTLSECVFQDLAEVESLHPDLIILDLKMDKGEDGWSFLGRLGEHHPLKDIPLLLCTAILFDPPFEEEEITILSKPFDLDELVQCVQRCLSRNQTT
jgi:CheY-like chemotaxis protein